MIHGTPNKSKVLLNYRRQTPMDRLKSDRSNKSLSSLSQWIGI